MRAEIKSLATFVPPRLLTNADLGTREVSGVFRLDMLDTALGTLTEELQVQRFDLAARPQDHHQVHRAAREGDEQQDVEHG